MLESLYIIQHPAAFVNGFFHFFKKIFISPPLAAAESQKNYNLCRMHDPVFVKKTPFLRAFCTKMKFLSQLLARIYRIFIFLLTISEICYIIISIVTEKPTK